MPSTRRYIGPTLHWPGVTLARRYIGPALYWPVGASLAFGVVARLVVFGVVFRVSFGEALDMVGCGRGGEAGGRGVFARP